MIRCPHWQASAPPVHLATAEEKKQRPSFDRTPAGRVIPASKQTTAGSGANAPDTALSRTARTRSGKVDVATLRSAARVVGQGTTGAKSASARAACQTHMVRAGETLFSIAAKRLGDGKQWARVRDANGGLDPTRLIPGMRLILPCGTGVGVKVAGATTSGASGIGAQNSKASVSSNAKPAAVVSTPRPAPVWTAKKGETFRAVIERWAKRADHTVIVDTSDAWTIAVPVRLKGDFKTAIGALVRGLSHDGVAPPVRLYPNRVVRVGL